MGMNEQIREIIDLDHRAESIVHSAVEAAEAMERETGQIIKSHRDEVLQETKTISQQNYQAQMKEAESEKERIIHEMDEKLECVNAAYHLHKEAWAREILEKLLRQEG